MTVIGSMIVLVALLLIGIPIPFTFLAASAYFVFFGGINAMSLIPFGFSKMNSILLLTIPLFVLAGAIMDIGGIGRVLVGAIERKVARKTGGLGNVTVVSCAVFGSISGSSSATLTCIGAIMAPRLKESGYNAGFYGALIASSGVLGILIPPSMLMILYAWVGGQSVLASFLSTVGPGFMLVVLFCAINIYYAKRNPDNKIYKKPTHEATEDANSSIEAKKKEPSAIAALIMPVIILGSIYGGILTPTEAAAMSVLYAIPVGFFVYKGLNLKTFKAALVQSGTTTGIIMIMLFSVMILSRLFVMENLPQNLLAILMLASSNKYVIMMMINIFMVIVGMLMDDVSGVLLCTPILLPVVLAIGFSPVHFAAIVGVNLGMGNITPPTAPLLYLAARVCDAEVKDMLKPTFVLIAFAWLPTLILTTYVPAISLALPRLLGYA